MQRLTPESAIEERIAFAIAMQKRRIIRQLHVIGEKCINHARSIDTYTDQTGNLRSSIGYVMVVDGEVTYISSFEVVKQGVEGASTGREFAISLAERFPRGVALIVVAGMNYAAHVATRYDVIDSAQLLAKRLITEMMQGLGSINRQQRRRR
jgi:hypothetical protein